MYDMILFRGDLPDDLYAMLRPFTPDEEETSRDRFGTMVHGVTTFKNGVSGAWPPGCKQQSEILGYIGVCRAYYSAPEFLPRHFEWERVNPDEPDKHRWQFGGTLIDTNLRLATSIRVVGAKTGPLH